MADAERWFLSKCPTNGATTSCACDIELEEPCPGDANEFEVMSVAEHQELRAALEYCVLDCCAKTFDDEVGDALVLGPDPCESCERAMKALSA